MVWRPGRPFRLQSLAVFRHPGTVPGARTPLPHLRPKEPFASPQSPPGRCAPPSPPGWLRFCPQPLWSAAGDAAPCLLREKPRQSFQPRSRRGSRAVPAPGRCRLRPARHFLRGLRPGCNRSCRPWWLWITQKAARRLPRARGPGCEQGRGAGLFPGPPPLPWAGASPLPSPPTPPPPSPRARVSSTSSPGWGLLLPLPQARLPSSLSSPPVLRLGSTPPLPRLGSPSLLFIPRLGSPPPPPRLGAPPFPPP